MTFKNKWVAMLDKNAAKPAVIDQIQHLYIQLEIAWLPYWF